MTKLAPLITGFLRDYMPRQRGYSPQSCETYAFSFKLLFNFAAKRRGTRPSQLAIEDLNAPLIVAFLAHLEQERGNGASTRNLRLAAIKTFIRYVEHKVPLTIRGKGRKERCLPLWKETARDLRAWLSVRGAVRVPELFVNAQDEPMTRAGFE
jgi:site-specific recombinase XerD